jgi:fatty-acyl-CoA synthase
MSRPKVWLHGENTSGFERIDHAIAHYSPDPPTLAERRPVTIADRALLIYTSGTTGLPKAANVSHRRLLQWSFWFAGLMNATPHDCMTTACRSFTASAAWSQPARSWCAAARC